MLMFFGNSLAQLLAVLDAAHIRGGVRRRGKAVREAVRRHKLLGYPIAVSRDGEVVWIPPEEIEVPPEEDEESSGAP